MNEHTARAEALRILARGALSSGRLAAKLRDKGYGPEEIGEAIAYCTERRYIDDLSYARRAWEQGRQKGYAGPVLTQRLRALGIGHDMIQALRAEAEAQEDGDAERDALRRTLEKVRKRNRPWDEGERRRCMAALARRGFSFGSIREVMDTYEDADED